MPHLTQAKQAARQYQVILSEEEGTWYGRGLELPHVFGEGKTAAACLRNTQEAFVAAVNYLLERGERPPVPAREGTRSQQVNVRLTVEEKALLESVARRKGYSGLSDFIRAAAVDAAR